MASCSGCTTTWTAETLCHCGACHRTFHTVDSFDRHRKTMVGEHGTCLNMNASGLRWRQRYNITAWGLPSEGKIAPKSPGKLGSKPTNTKGVG